MSATAQARARNARALDPKRSVVIEACAGSGKTWLLVSRIIRLLLAGARPSEILAITFTRKAAQEMQERLHAWLRELAVADDAAVKRFLRDREIADDQIDDMLPRARALFEDFLADQPGITINTFHGWFLQLLKRAPLAAGFAGSTNLVERTSPLIGEAWESFAEKLQRSPDGPVARALSWLFEKYGLVNTRNLLTGFLDKRVEWWAFTRGTDSPFSGALDKLREGLPVAPDADVIGDLLGDANFISDLGSYAELLERNALPTDSDFAARLRGAVQMAPGPDSFDRIRSVVLTEKGEVRSRKASASGQKKLGKQAQEQFLDLHASIAERVRRVIALCVEQDVYRLNEAGLSCGDALLDEYQSTKRAHGMIDYADVEWLVWTLLNTSDYAEYMQYRLDARYRHILLDEFQDTNPLQWQILRTWLEAAADVQSQPSVFLVGDPKQSIYRFRRAEPRLFDIARDYLCQRHGAETLHQNLTRRNAPAVVSVVNTVFTGKIEAFQQHVAHAADLPGKVEVLPLCDVPPEDHSPAMRWRNPLDESREDAADRCREREADELAAWVQAKVGRMQIVDGEKLRALRFEDVYVLVRRRTHLHVYERSLRHARIPYISSRQGGLLDTLEADDLTALLHFLVVPFADIHLAAALRSPMFSVSDADLMAISQASGHHWWARLCVLVDEGGASAALIRARQLLGSWTKLVDLMPVHDLLDRIYFEAEVMQRYCTAVPEAMREGVVANLRAFMEVALSTDSGRYPSLQGFLHSLVNMRRANAEEAPDVGSIAQGSNAVRILTVHGAKGLEAPVVWLVDSNARAPRPDSFSVLVEWPPEAPAPEHFSLFGRKEERGESRSLRFENEARLAAREELNLLYVAMTRAKQILIASGSESPNRRESWYRRMQAAAAASEIHADFPVADVPVRAVDSPVSATVGATTLARLNAPLNVGVRNADLVDPRRRHGTLVHALLEKCVEPSGIADRDFLQHMLAVSDVEFETLWRAMRSIIDEPALSRFFDPDQYLRAWNELAYAATDGGLRRIDRVVEFADDIWVLDYKTGDTFDPDHPETAVAPHRNQLEDYRTAVSVLMPGKPVRSALIFAGGLFHALHQ